MTMRGAALRRVAPFALAVLVASCGGGGDERAPLATANDGREASRERLADVTTPSTWVEVPQTADPLLANLSIPSTAPTRGMWSPVYAWPMNALHGTVLPSGRVLTYGTNADGSGQDGRYVDVWNPAQGFVPAAHASTYRSDQQDSFCSAATYLTDGRLMISGGNGSVTSSFYTPADNTMATSAARLADERWYTTMLTLADGRPLVLGGMVPYSEGMQGNPDQSVAQGLASMTPEVFESTAWRSLFGAYSRLAFGPDYLRASYPRAWVAPDGRVFGISAEQMWVLDAGGNGAIASAGPFKSAPDTTTKPNVGATNSAAMYDVGRILVVGGNGSFNGDALPASAAVTAIDLNGAAPVLTEQQAMSQPRRYPNTIALPDGKVLVTGGTAYGNDDARAVFAAELWNPQTRTWTVGASASIYRGYHSFTMLLPNGTVLSTGGGTPGPVVNLNAEVYYPPQLFRVVNGTAQLAPRPVIRALSAPAFANGATLQLDMAQASSTLSQLVLIGLSSGTHSFNAGQRRIPLAFTQDSIRVTTTLPSSALAPPGYYQLVAIDTAGVPSVGAIVAIGPGVRAPPVATTPYNPPAIAAAIDAPIIAAGGTAVLSITQLAGTTYSWDFGDGSAATAYASSASTSHRYDVAGLYTVTVTARSTDGSTARRTAVQAVAVAPTSRGAVQSSAVALETRASASARVWTVNPDTQSVAVIDTASRSRVAEIAVGVSPRSLAIAPDGRVWVVNKESASISIVDARTLATATTVALPAASQPHGLVFAPGGGAAYVVLEAMGRVLKLDASSGAQLAAVDVGANPRHLAMTADGAQLLVSRFVTPPLAGEGTAAVTTTSGGGEVVVVAASSFAVSRTVVLRHSDKVDNEIQGAGVPNYLGAPAISPDGKAAWIPSKQDNVKRGTLRNGRPLDFQNTVRAISARVDLSTWAEDYARRTDHDNAGLASAAVFHPSGIYLFVALETSRQVAVINATKGSELLRVDVGRAPQGLAVSADGTQLYVQNFMDRTLDVLDLGSLTHGTLAVSRLASVPTIATEQLDANVLAGKRLFYDARDPRLARDGYLSCAACHNDGGHDGRTWDFTGFGEGLRNTPSLRGRAGLGQGFLHWSANFDEAQDFEGQIRAFAGGTGLMSDAAYAAGTRNQPLGTTKAGQSADLDALAAYLTSLTSFPASPWRNADGSATSDAVTGRAVFAQRNCAACHGGAGFTASGDATMLKDIGTIKASSGKRLGVTLPGIDVPTLRDAWATAPYLHDGSAPTLAAALAAHSTTTLGGSALSNAEVTGLAAFLAQIGAQESAPGTTNLALGRPATQSSVGFGGDPGRAVDGNTNGVFNNNSVTHTNTEAQPWWQVDLGGPSRVDAVVLWNRTDCCADRLANLIVLVSSTDMTGRTLAQLQSDASVTKVQVASLNGASSQTVPIAKAGRYVRVQLAGSNVLSLAEVQVQGSRNLSLGKAATQSSTDFGGVASRAVDGNTAGAWSAGSVTHTATESQPWWQVDLGAAAAIGSVELWNRTDCCSDRLSNAVVFASPADMTGRTYAQLLADPAVAKVRVASLSGVPNRVVPLDASARYVRVQLAGTGNLSLAEAIVWGK